jgi:hypothetical protein
MEKDHIVAEIRRTAVLNGGAPLGVERFRAATGINRSDWLGKLWARWGDALREAGFEPNQLQGPLTDDDLLTRLADFTRELGRLPVNSEIKLRARTDPAFPWHNTFARLGDKQGLALRLRQFCEERGELDVAALCSVAIMPVNQAGSSRVAKGREAELGSVYLLRSGRYHKIGRTNAVGRRGRELAIQLPEAAKMIHEIKTDDPAGIEDYWHKRFGDRRKNGEWFELTAEDVAAFKRRKFM